MQRPLFGRPGKGAGGGAGLLTLSGGVGRELDDEVSVEGRADSFQQRDCGHDAAGFQAAEGRLDHVSAGRELALGQSQGQAAFADRRPDLVLDVAELIWEPIAG